MKLTDDDLKELFSLMTSSTHYELAQIYESEDLHYFREVDLDEIYEICQEKREHALDAWRAVIYFLHRRGCKLKDGEQELDLGFIKSEFID